MKKIPSMLGDLDPEEVSLNYPLFTGPRCVYCKFSRRSRLARARHATEEVRRGFAYKIGNRPFAIVLKAQTLVECPS